jgi:hypothetical protein
MNDRVTIDRLSVTLEGWPTAAAEDLGNALERALAGRLAAARIARDGATASSVSLGVVRLHAGGDAAALAELLADRLAGWLADGGTLGERGDG